MDIREAIGHNLSNVVQSVVAWFLCVWGHVIGIQYQVDVMVIATPFIALVIPYLQAASYVLAGLASCYTIWKIRKDVKKK